MKLKYIIIMGILSMLFSCKTYTISVDSFQKQMVNAKSENLKEVEINNPSPYMYQNIGYLANGIKSIDVIDKNGNKVALENSPKLEMRITKKDGKTNILLFDTVTVENDTLKGARSRLMQNLRREIPLNDIKKIEIQNSGKVYKYKESKK